MIMKHKTYLRSIKPKHAAKHYDTIVLGDVHLGLSNCRIGGLLEFIKNNSCKRLIFQGDTFNSPGLTELPKEHQQFLDQVRKREAEGLEVVWIKGNHELMRRGKKFVSQLSALLDRFYRAGCTVLEEYTFTLGKRKFLILHGHVFDQILTNLPLTSQLATWTYEQIQKLDTEEQSLATLLKHNTKKVLQLVRILRQEALLYASLSGSNVVVCGHTHKLEHAKAGEEGEWLHYYNAGCWTEKKCGAVAIEKNGQVHLLRITTWRKPH
jgi:UDP-2,3-diacylglucosamine pyrophosphatase LpxH